MCGIFGYIGHSSASDSIVRGLQRLEYRGYDSAGLCVINEKKEAKVLKSTGRVIELKNLTGSIPLSEYHTGIGHTRWATHGKVTEANCHPHSSASRRFFVVHNGIIENYAELRHQLETQGIPFYSQTDSEVPVKLFEQEFTGDYLETLKILTQKVTGAYALVFVDKERPDMLFGAKLGSPLVIGFGKNEGEWYVASDYRSLADNAESYITLEDGDMFMITGNDYTIVNNGTEINRSREAMVEDEKAQELGEYSSYMQKEIHEQPNVIRNVLAGRVNFEAKTIHHESFDAVIEHGFDRVEIIASGTSSHAGLVGKYYLEELAGIPTSVIVSTEFKYQRNFINDKTLYIFISQSGETADTLDALKLVNGRNGFTFGLVNVPGSSIARHSRVGAYTHAGIEVGVASTKAFTAQITTLFLLALAWGYRRDLDYSRYTELLHGLQELPNIVSRTLAQEETMANLAKKYQGAKNFFYLGRLLELPVAMEGSLKLKELSYLHSEAYSSGELKHGPIALIDEVFPTILLNAHSRLSEKNSSSAEEIRARDGKVIGIISESDAKRNIYADVVTIEDMPYEFSPFAEVVLLQLFAYHMTLLLGNDVDKPRNLAKSVTVE